MEDYINDIQIILTDQQANYINDWLVEKSIAKQKSQSVVGFINTNGGSARTDWEYIKTEQSTGYPLNWINKGDTNSTSYGEGEIDRNKNFVYKLKQWGESGDSRYSQTQEPMNLISDDEIEKLLNTIMKSSGSYKNNDWIYSLASKNKSSSDRSESCAIFDIHDRRIDDPNNPLIVRGGIIVGNPEDPNLSIPFNAFGESEIKNTLIAGNLLDSQGEINTKESGHQIPNEIDPKVFLSRNSHRTNQENWTDTFDRVEDGTAIYTNGIGDGTIEASEQVLTHADVVAEHGIKIKDAAFNDAAALEIENDGAVIHGHTYVEEEGFQNIFWLDDTEIKQAKGQNWVSPEKSIVNSCYFSEQDVCESSITRDENTIDLYKGILYKIFLLKKAPKENYVYYTNSERYYYKDGQYNVVNLGEPNVNSDYYYNNNTYYRVDKTNVKIKPIAEIQINSFIFENNEVVGMTKNYPIKINQQVKQVYQLNHAFNNSNGEISWIENEQFSAGDYIYWTGKQFIKVSTDAADLKEAKALLTVGVRDEEVEGGNGSIEIGNNVAASGNNSAVIGQNLNNEVNNSLMIGGEDGDGHVISVHNSDEETIYMTHDGDLVVGHKATLGTQAASHELSLEVEQCSQFDQQVEIKRDSRDIAESDVELETGDTSLDDNNLVSFKERGKSLFNDTLTIGYPHDEDDPNEDGLYENGTFWGNLDSDSQFSKFTGLNVHGEIRNERIPEELYTSVTVGDQKILNEFADKFFVNSSIATSTATYRGGVSFVDYGFEEVGEVSEEVYECNSLGDAPYPYLGVDGMTKYVKTNENKYYEKKEIDYSDITEATAWLNNDIAGITVIVKEQKDLPVEADDGTLAYVVLENKYYKYDSEIEQENKWEEIEEEDFKVCDSNDYCFFQLTEKKQTVEIPEEVVLFSDGNEVSDDQNESKKYPVQNTYYRFKFVETRHPITHAYISGEWKFEYQVNNSGFTQKQWQAINSGLSSSWREQVEGDINNRMLKDNPVGTGSFSMNRMEDSIVGEDSVAVGYNNIASGDCSHAEGDHTKALGEYSHAEGHLTEASGKDSHAEGERTKATGIHSHAEGWLSIAQGARSHAEGAGTDASGSDSHAEGSSTTASGQASHSEGRDTIASGDYSHAEGNSSEANGANSHAENGSINNGDYAHTEGISKIENFKTSSLGTTFYSYHAHAEGEGEIYGSMAAHAEGSGIVGLHNSQHRPSDYAHAEGQDTVACNYAAHAEGMMSEAIGGQAHSEGYMTIAQGSSSHSEGQYTKATGYGAHAEGVGYYDQDNNLIVYCEASGEGSHAEGHKTAASGKYAHAEGEITEASGDASHSEGINTVADGPFSHAEGETATAHGWGAHAEGVQTYAGDNTKLVGHPDNQAAHAEGSQTVAKGRSSHAEGQSTIAEGNSSHAEGYHTIVSSLGGHVSGRYNATHNSTDLFIVGNGTNDENLSNAFLIDTNGNVFIKGRLFVEADENSAHGKEAGKKPNNYTLNESSGIVVTRFIPDQEYNDTVPRTFESLNDKDSYIVFSATNADGAPATYKLDFLGVVGDIGNQTVYYGNYFCRVWTNNFTAPLGTREWQVDFTQ